MSVSLFARRGSGSEREPHLYEDHGQVKNVSPGNCARVRFIIAFQLDDIPTQEAEQSPISGAK